MQLKFVTAIFLSLTMKLSDKRVMGFGVTRFSAFKQPDFNNIISHVSYGIGKAAIFMALSNLISFLVCHVVSRQATNFI